MTNTEDRPHILAIQHHRADASHEGPHTGRHDAHLLSLLLRGRGAYRSGSLDLPGLAPWWALFPQGDEDCFGLVGDYEIWYVAFTWPALELRAAGDAEVRVSADGRTQLVSRCVVPGRDDLAKAIGLYEQVKTMYARQDLAGQWLLQSAFLSLFSAFLEAPLAGGQASAHGIVTEFRRLLEEQAFSPAPIQELYETAHLSRDHLCALFKRQYGLTPHAYRTSLRLHEAMRLLRSRLNVSEVAARVGYPDALYFSRVFHQHFGLPPSHVIRFYPHRATE